METSICDATGGPGAAPRGVRARARLGRVSICASSLAGAPERGALEMAHGSAPARAGARRGAGSPAAAQLTMVPSFSPKQTRRMLPGDILKTWIGRWFSRQSVTAVESITPRCAARNWS